MAVFVQPGTHAVHDGDEGNETDAYTHLHENVVTLDDRPEWHLGMKLQGGKHQLNHGTGKKGRSQEPHGGESHHGVSLQTRADCCRGHEA